MKIGWFIKKTYTGKVKIQGQSLSDQSLVYFEFSDAPTTTPVLDPAKPSGFISDLNDWAFFPSIVTVSKPGCYQIKAEWDGGMWQQAVAFTTSK